MSHKILIELDEDMEKMLRDRAEALGVSISECAREILEMATDCELVHIDLVQEPVRVIKTDWTVKSTWEQK